MKRWIIRTIKVTAVAVVTLGAVGCMMHALRPHVDEPEASEFGLDMPS